MNHYCHAHAPLFFNLEEVVLISHFAVARLACYVLGGWHLLQLLQVGHNFGLEHAKRGSAEYGDPTSALGGDGVAAPVCYNGPQLVMLGWAGLALHLDAHNMTAGRYYNVTLPALGTVFNALLRVDMPQVGNIQQWHAVYVDLGTGCCW